MNERGRETAERIVKCAAAFAAGFYAAAAIACAIDVYVFDNYDPKFGPDETFHIGMLAFAVIDGGLTLLCLLAAFCGRRKLINAEPFWRVLVLYAVAGAFCMFVLFVIARING